MNRTACREKLTALLEDHNTRISRANAFLNSIKNAMADNTLEILQQLVSNPDLATEDIEQLEQQRHQLMESFGFSQDNDGFEKCVSWCDNEQKRVTTLYQQLIAGLVQLQQSIQINSLLIIKGQDRVRRSLGVLTGSASAGNYKAYSSNGKSMSQTGQRDLAIV